MEHEEGSVSSVPRVTRNKVAPYNSENDVHSYDCTPKRVKKKRKKSKVQFCEPDQTYINSLSIRSYKDTLEYEIIMEVNKFRESSMFPPLKAKFSLQNYASDLALGLNPIIETNGNFVVVSVMHFKDVYNQESAKQLLNKWIYDSNKLFILLSTGSTATVSFVEVGDVQYVIFLIVSMFNP